LLWPESEYVIVSAFNKSIINRAFEHEKKVLRPEWIFDSYSKGTLLPVGPYEHVRYQAPYITPLRSKTTVAKHSLSASPTKQRRRLLSGPPTPVKSRRGNGYEYTHKDLRWALEIASWMYERDKSLNVENLGKELSKRAPHRGPSGWATLVRFAFKQPDSYFAQDPLASPASDIAELQQKVVCWRKLVGHSAT